MANNVNIAHFRVIPHKTECHLLFSFFYDKICEDINVVCDVTDSVTSLQSHTKNKIVDLLKKNGINDIHINVKILVSNKPTRNSCENLLHVIEDVNLKINETNYKVVLNAPYVQEVLFPTLLFVGDIVVPVKLRLIHAVKKLTEFEWFTSKDKTKWKSVGDEESYFVKKEDLGSFLKLKIFPNGNHVKGIEFEAVSDNKIEDFRWPMKCPFEDNHNQLTNNKLEGNSYRIVSYNILSERYTNDGFSYCPPEFLSVDYRKHILAKEIIGYNADILCLQEVDDKIIQLFFKKKFEEHNYAAIYNKKGNRIPEGLATVYRKDRFKKIESKHYILASEFRRNALFKDMWQRISCIRELKEKIMKQATSCQITVFIEKNTNKIFLVVNTHLFYRPPDHCIRLIQIGIIMKLVESNCKILKRRHHSNPILLMCGDLNSKPSSGVYEFLSKGRLKSNHPDWNCEEQVITDVVLKHHFDLVSAYGTPKYTNYVANFNGCLDYIFFDKRQMEKLQIVPLPCEDLVTKNVALPSKVFPSDHLALIVDLKRLT